MSALDALFGFGQSWQDVLSVGKLEVKHMLVLLTLFASEHPITKEHIALPKSDYSTRCDSTVRRASKPCGYKTKHND